VWARGSEPETQTVTKEEIVMRNPFRTDPRLGCATFIEELLDEAARPVPASMRRFLPIYRRTVVQACAGPLAEIAAALRDPERSVSDNALRRVDAFLTRGDQSPLYGDDPLQAKWEADWLLFAVAADNHPVTTSPESLV
jgi:hypothetical protein